MRFVARAPGKLVVLGEYAVLDGAPALVLAVDRYCHASIRPSEDSACRLETRAPRPRRIRRKPGEPTGVALVDLVCRETPELHKLAPWRAVLDSTELFGTQGKLGIGSSAAALCAWAGVWAAWTGAARLEPPKPQVEHLIRLHRAFQHGAGSGLDVAASLTGGAVEFRLEDGAIPRVATVRLPERVLLKGVFTGSNASTPGLVARYREWAAARPEAAQRQWRGMAAVAEAGCAAARNEDAGAFLGAVTDYGRHLESLGKAMGADNVTAEHRAIGAAADEHDISYKVSGAGGGDLGIALARDPDALAAFASAVRSKGYPVIDLDIDRQGLTVEEHPE